ncbi:Biotin/lipoate A/B protein ligase [Scheffersomyces spartinae]|uniref:Putative lipoate-protein ligase A n=1 Tax=Scheffersomyces spartinae TaxID=45513 RepID=A0A9P7V6M1_9ASCO|nr:Biotin/lipoate A/B protein ligase [Scheffersomyces spartinae]KAG7192136.1 Biotin/lipoate A/B protein ligase [Scheffersomyces spartinae]
MIRSVVPKLRRLPTVFVRRTHFQVPFEDDLTTVDDDDFGLAGFQLYKESPDVLRQKELLGLELRSDVASAEPVPATAAATASLSETACLRQPIIFSSKLHDPYLNLAIEDYIYNQMPLPTSEDEHNCNRLMLYVNSPCVVIGKNQNPWAETNLPLLNALGIPLVRRRSGGGTVVHDLGNVNYSFMTTKQKFDRFNFSRLITESITELCSLKVNDRGDIVDGPTGKKVSGSAYKLSKGKSYHHGTMLLSLNLDVLRRLLRRDEAKVGHVDLKSSVKSVRSPVVNIGIPIDRFIQLVSSGFALNYGVTVLPINELDEMLGLPSFAENACTTFTIDEDTPLPVEVLQTVEELKQWSWRFGHTPLFTHTFKSATHGLQVTFHIGKNARLIDFEIATETTGGATASSFDMLRLMINTHGYVEYKGSTIAGFITDDSISEWIGVSIDGTS